MTRITKRTNGGPIMITKNADGTLQLSSDYIQFTSPVKVTTDTGTIKVFQQGEDGEWEELKQTITRCGYVTVYPHCKTKRCKYVKPHITYVHRLVATAFVDNPRGVPFVDHIDGDRENNNPANLRWVTMRENQLYRRLHEFNKMKSHNRGAYSNSRKMYRMIKVTRADQPEPRYFRMITHAARAIGCTPQNISRCMKYGFKPVGYTVEFVENVG